MATTAKVYLHDGIPIEIKNAHRVIYFPDQSVHILDDHDRPVFIGAPGRYVAVVVEYALDREPEERQKVPGPVVKSASKVPGAIVPVQPVPQRQEQESTPQSPPPGFPPVGESRPAQQPEPGEVKVTPLSERESDGETTQEMMAVNPVKVVETSHQDFLRAPQTAGRP